MKYELSKHAVDQMKKRDISRNIVNEVFKNTDDIVKHDSCLTVYQKVIEEKENKYLYRIFVNICKRPALIVTVYKTSKIKKYENKIR